MSARLQLRVEQRGMDESASHAVVANVYAVEPGTGGDRRNVVVPVGYGESHEVTVPAGRYVVEALLPSGGVVTREVAVEDGEAAVVELEGEKSPYEWLAWQQLVGNVEAGHARAAMHERALELAPSGPKVEWIGDPVPALRGDQADAGDAWTAVVDQFDRPAPSARLSQAATRQLEPAARDPLVQLYRVNADGEAAWGQQPPPAAPLPRRYLMVGSGPQVELVCLPVPWKQTSSPEQAVVEVLVRSRNSERPGVALSVRDPELGTALAYMTIGRLSEAVVLIEQARHMLFGKVINQLAAAGGGYVLLGSGPENQPADWHEWIENLYSWFPWVPDGAIQHAWLLLQQRRTDADLDEARTALVDAYRRGLPYYSVGVQWLLDGLTLFAGESDEIDAMLKRVQQVAWRTNVQQPFTTVRLRRGS